MAQQIKTIDDIWPRLASAWDKLDAEGDSSVKVVSTECNVAGKLLSIAKLNLAVAKIQGRMPDSPFLPQPALPKITAKRRKQNERRLGKK